MSFKKTDAASKVARIFKTLGKVFGTLASVLLTVMLIGITTGIIVGVTFFAYCSENLFDFDYDISNLQFSLDMTTKIYYPEYADVERTQLLGYVEMEDQSLYGTENRYWAPIQEMPKNLTNAFIAIEDKRFYQHNGIDIRRTLGAFLELLKGNKSYGGSTITQQLVKNITDERDGTIQRKVTEITRAISLTQKRAKSEVLEMYLNTIPLSHGNYGVSAAAKYYFNKEVSELTLVECAALASIPKSPTKYDPERNPEENKERRETVLWEMYDQGLISEEEYNQAAGSELVLDITIDEPATVVYSYFTDEVRRQVQQDLMEQYGYSKEIASQLVLSGGLEIYTTVDPYIQNALEEVYEDENSFKKVDDGIQPESAMVIMAPDTGDVLGCVGGRGEKTGNMVLNRATMSKRQIGSAIKPISVYAPAIDLGLINYGSVLDDTPVEFSEQLGRYWPKNSPAVYDGKVTVSRALAVSKNTAAVKILQQLTPQYSYDFLTQRLGVESLVASDIDESPMALGGLTYGMTTLEVVGAYSMLANNGVYSEPRFYTKVVDSTGKVILEKKENHSIVIDKSTSQIMTKLLTEVVETGTATAITLDQKIEVAGKTGTTNNNYNIYFAGYTPYYIGATWFGYDQNRSLARFGTSPALLAWDKVMTKIHERVFEQVSDNEQELRTFDYSELVTAEYCRDSGLKPSELCKVDVRGSRVQTGYYKSGAEPEKTCDVHQVLKWDSSTKSIASDNCPSESVGAIVLVKVGEERIFDHELVISDAAYTFMDVPEDYVYPVERNTAFFSNLLDGKFYGYVPGESIPFNSYCTIHADASELEGGIPEDEPEPEEPVGDDEGSGQDDGHGDVTDIFDIIDTPSSPDDEPEEDEENTEQ